MTAALLSGVDGLTLALAYLAVALVAMAATAYWLHRTTEGATVRHVEAHHGEPAGTDGFTATELTVLANYYPSTRRGPEWSLVPATKVALAYLWAAGLVRLDDDRLRVSGSLPDDADPMVRTVYAGLATFDGHLVDPEADMSVASRMAYTDEMRAAIAPVIERITNAGYLITTDRCRLLRRGPYGLGLLAVAGPEAALVVWSWASLLCVAAALALAGLAVLLDRRYVDPHMTRRVRNHWHALRADNAHLSPERHPAYRTYGPARTALASAIFPRNAIEIADPALYDALTRSRYSRRRRSGWRSTGSGGSVGSSGSDYGSWVSYGGNSGGCGGGSSGGGGYSGGGGGY